jgi:UDP-N-acetyl-D-galactosamine dehydrogenase
VDEKVAVIGLGYVGLPVALAFARRFPGCVGFDVDEAKVAELRRGQDRNRVVSQSALAESALEVTSDPARLAGRTFFVVAVPTPVDRNNVPDLAPIVRASETVGERLSPGAVVVYESTVYPGMTEEVCAPILAKKSGLRCGVDFTLGYSPERINPGDPEHTLETITKVIAAQDTATLERMAAAYGAIALAGLHRAPSIRVAEAAKVIENTQRDLNVALMNELALICDRMGVRTADVLAAAATKWNFLRFQPGLVGGHCIGVDPYYLTMKAQQLGHQPEVILAGRRINDSMGSYVAQRMVKLLVQSDIPVRGARVGVLGLTFKEDCADIRNSKVPDIVRELRAFGVHALVHDPLAAPDEAVSQYGLALSPLEELAELDGLVLAVIHKEYAALGAERLGALVREGGVLCDVKSALDPAHIGLGRRKIRYWSL